MLAPKTLVLITSYQKAAIKLSRFRQPINDGGCFSCPRQIRGCFVSAAEETVLYFSREFLISPNDASTNL